MNNIDFIGYFGDMAVHVNFSMPYRSANIWRITIDKRFCADIKKMDHIWIAEHNPGQLQADDIMVAGEILKSGATIKASTITSRLIGFDGSFHL